GERYILGGVNTTLKEFAETVCAIAGINRPMIVPRALAKFGAYMSEWWGLLTGNLGALTLTSYYHLEYGQHYSSKKAETELGYKPTTDLADAIQRELQWHGVAPLAPRDQGPEVRDQGTATATSDPC